MPAKQATSQLRRRPLLGCLVSLVGLFFAGGLFGSESFISVTPASSGPRGNAFQPLGPQAREARLRLALRASNAGAADVSGDEDDFKTKVDKFFDRWNTKGGALAGMVIMIFLGFAMEKLFEFLAGGDAGGNKVVLDSSSDLAFNTLTASQKAGVATTTFFSVCIFYWTGTYLWRVENKQTTYAQQLADYEQAVMMSRLKQLSDEEIEALCEEVGIESSEIDDVFAEVGSEDAKGKELSKKEKIIQLFMNTQRTSNIDPRGQMKMPKFG
eukprot:TRINITY_DN80279_c0_g1_i1.p1 TRINITY_DN80279_c0_g1~~TRINITY_DN80279_c0_g1_i1.p1  ORF type:complete len:269 (+),score=74.62 TRINITY_DN80279_c0_g1_i1:66-872(+)